MEQNENPFEELDEGAEEVPERLKNQVIGSYNFIGGVFRGVELFVENFTIALLGLVKLLGSLGHDDEDAEEDAPPKNN